MTDEDKSHLRIDLLKNFLQKPIVNYSAILSEVLKMSNASDCARTGLRAFFTKLDITANNIANVDTEDFKKSRAELQEATPYCVKVSANRIDTQGMPLPTDEYQPTANESSNVVLEEEFVEVIETQHMYAANLKTIETQDEMERSLIDILV